MSQESKNLRIEERKNRKHINRGTQQSKITESCAQCTLVLLDVSSIEERKNRRTQESKDARTDELWTLRAYAPCALAPLGLSRIEKLRNFRTLEPKNTWTEDLCALRPRHIKLLTTCANACLLSYLRASY